MVDTTTAPDPIVDLLAGEVITELLHHPDSPLSYYKSGGDDFSYVEEALKVSLRKEDYYTADHHVEALRIVFEWLKAYHGIDPPHGFMEATCRG